MAFLISFYIEILASVACEFYKKMVCEKLKKMYYKIRKSCQVCFLSVMHLLTQTPTFQCIETYIQSKIVIKNYYMSFFISNINKFELDLGLKGVRCLQ